MSGLGLPLLRVAVQHYYNTMLCDQIRLKIAKLLVWKVWELQRRSLSPLSTTMTVNLEVLS